MTTLKAALQEACFMELEDIPSEEELSADKSLTFSAAFERKMKKLIRRANHPIRYRVTQAAACILLAALLSGCAVLAINPEVRSAFVGWIRETYETWFVYRYVGENKGNSEDIFYYPTWIPDGYYETSRFDTDTQATIIYEDNDNHLITFYYVRDADTTSIYLEQEGVDIKSVLIGNIFADLYLDEIEENANSLVWVDEKCGVLFCISANCNEEELIKIAESVEAQEIPKPQMVYQPTWIPDGFVEVSQSASEDQICIIYNDDNFNSIMFLCTRNMESASLYIQRDEVDAQTVQIGGLDADLYLDQNIGGANALVWRTADTLFSLHGNCSGDELIKIAESVTVQEVPKQEVF